MAVQRSLRKLSEWVSTKQFGATGGGTADDAAGLQAAMNFAVANNLELVAPAKETYLIGSGLSIPSGLQMDFRGSTIKRKTGSVFNMLSNTGGSQIKIRRLVVDGNRLADGRVATNVGDRFGGIVLTNVTDSELRDVDANNTVNAEDGRAGVYLNGCSGVDLYEVGGSGNDRSALFIENSKVRIFGSKTKDNLGSGVTSQLADDSEYYDIEAVNSGYSGISINGKRSKARGLRATGTAVGYAGVNIGHDDASNRADDSIIENVHSYGNLGWNLNISGSTNVQVIGAHLGTAGVTGLRVADNSTACTFEALNIKDSTSSGALFLSGSGHKILSGEIVGNGAHGIDVETGVGVSIARQVRSYNNGKLTAACAGILLNGAVSSHVAAECFDNQGTKTQEYGVWLNGGSANELNGAYIRANKTQDIRESGSPVYVSRNVRTGTDLTAGTFNCPTTVTTVTVTNNNARAGMVVVFYALNSQGTALGIPRLGTITPGVSFVANMNGNTGGAEAYGYIII